MLLLPHFVSLHLGWPRSEETHWLSRGLQRLRENIFLDLSQASQSPLVCFGEMVSYGGDKDRIELQVSQGHRAQWGRDMVGNHG